MDALQIALLLAGIAVVAAIYFFYFLKSSSRKTGQPSARKPVDAGAIDRSRIVAIQERDAALPAADLAALGKIIADDGHASRNRQPAGRPSARPEPALTPTKTAAARPSGTAAGHSVPRTPKNAPALIIQLLVVARDGRRFRGPDVVAAITGSGLVLGDMEIFHCLVPGEQGDEPMFSVANVVEPGTFNINFIDHFETPGLVLFMTLPGPAEGKSAFGRMLDAARQIADTLKGDIRDQSRSVLTPQGIEHLQEQITEFERKRQVESLRAAHA